MRSLGDRAFDGSLDVESNTAWHQAGLMCCLLGFVLVPAFAVQDWLLFPEQFVFLFQIRLACVVATGIVLALLTLPFGRRHPRALTLIEAGVVGLMIMVMVMVTGGGASSRYAGLNLMLLAGAVLLPCSARLAVGLCVAIIGSYAALMMATGRVGQPAAFVAHLFYLSGTAGLAVMAVALRERLRHRELASRRALVTALRLQTEFTTKMSHELRTPINVLIGYADILLEEKLAGGGREAHVLVERMRRQGMLLHRLISDLLDLSKARAGKIDIHPERVPVAEVVEEVTESFRPMVERKGLALATVCRAETPEITTDRHRLTQILINLVGNAVKFTERGRITVEVESMATGAAPLAGYTVLVDEVRASLQSGLVIRVIDTGIGIPADGLARLAADFEQMEAAAAQYGGTGLGLSISRSLAQLLGGTLAVRSRRGEGSSFVLVLPNDAPASAAAA